MSYDTHGNFSYGLVTVAPSPATSGTTLSVSNAIAAVFPTPTTPYNCTVWPISVQPISSNSEIVRVTAKGAADSGGAGNTQLTITRIQESTSARSIVVGDQIAMTITAKTITDVEGGIPVKASTAELDTGTDDAKFATALAIAGSFLGVQGGWTPLGAATYEASDAPSYTISFASDMTGILSYGMKIKLTDSTVKFFKISNVGAYSGGKTIITVYGGTDYTLSGGAITLPYYSTKHHPFGFPNQKAKWTVTLSNGSLQTTATPTQNTFYNPGSLSISIPIGSWLIGYKVIAEYDKVALDGFGDITLSTANNSESNSAFTTRMGATKCTSFVGIHVISGVPLTVASKTTYYLNQVSRTANLDVMYFLGGTAPSVVTAIFDD